MSLLSAIMSPFRWLPRRLALLFLWYDHHISDKKNKLVVLSSDSLERLLNDLGHKTSVYRVSVDESGKATLHTYSDAGNEEDHSPVLEEAAEATSKPRRMHRPSVQVERPPGPQVGQTRRTANEIAAALNAASGLLTGVGGSIQGTRGEE